MVQKMIEERLRDLVSSAIQKHGIDYPANDVVIEVPRNEEYGVFATSAAFKLAKDFRKPPKIIGEDLSATISDISQQTGISAYPLNGFINFDLSDSYIHDEIMRIDDTYGQTNHGRGSTYLVEYVSANPTGPLHIGHGRWAAIGDSIVRMLREIGYNARSEFYINDAGNQIARFRESVNAAREQRPIPEDGYHGAYISELAASGEDPVAQMLHEQKVVLETFRCTFDTWFSEKALHESGRVKQAIDLMITRGVTYEQDGALWFKSTDFGDDKDRVIVRENGEPTYFAADIAYHFDKFRRGIDHAVDIWGADHHGYIARVKAAIQVVLQERLQDGELGIDDVFTVVIGQLVRLYRDGEEVRMSKRTGEMITLSEVIDEIGVDAARYFLAMRSSDQVLDFDLTLAKEQSNNNPVYYVQYAHARISSILVKAGIPAGPVALETGLEPDERKLLIKMIMFPGVLQRAALEYSPYMLAQYAQELATLFHGFYQRCRVISDDEQLMARRALYIDRVRTIIRKSLHLLGVSAPEKM